MAEREVHWSQSGTHNVCNGVAAIIAAHQVGVSLEHCCEALVEFVGVKRRMEVIYQADGVTVYDDFAHHPTAITDYPRRSARQSWDSQNYCRD